MTRPLACPLLLAFLLAGCATPKGGELGPADGRFEVVVLGSVQDGGLPHVGCLRACCREARRTGTVRYPACLGIHDTQTGKLVLVEATPAVEAQLALLHETTGQERGKRRPVDAVLVTHAHIGHYLGLAHFGREVASTKALPVWVSPRMGDFLAKNGPWSQLVALEQIALRRFKEGEAFSPIEGLEVTAIHVPHRNEYADTVAYRIRGPHATLLFCPDTDGWHKHPGLLERLLDGVDWAYLDGSFYDGSELPDRNMAEIPHPPMVQTMQLLAERATAQPGHMRFIHLNHTNPVLRQASLRASVVERGFGIAHRGERVRL